MCVSLSLYIYIYIYMYIYITFGWHYLSKAACLIRPHLFSTALLVLLIRLIEFAALFAALEETRVREVVFDKWFPLNFDISISLNKAK